jgi:ABC-type nitrate/sulfonate/bicarbonate transport system substrate-binding protein
MQGIISEGPIQWPAYTALEFGWFKEKGLDVELIVTRGGSGGAQQLAAGSIPLAYTGYPDFMRAINNGAPIKIVMNGVGVPPYSLIAKTEVKTIADLKGKLVSVDATKGVTLIYLAAMVKTAGLTLKDMDYVYAKINADRFAALMSGAVAATIIYPPFTFRALEHGYHSLGNFQTYLNDFPFTVYAVNTDWAARNRQTLLDYIGVYKRAVKWVYDPKNRDKALEILTRHSKTVPADAPKLYDYFVKDIQAFSNTGLIGDGAYQKMADSLIQSGDLKSPAPPKARFIDNSYVEATWK